MPKYAKFIKKSTNKQAQVGGSIDSGIDQWELFGDFVEIDAKKD